MSKFTHQDILEKLQTVFGEAIRSSEESYGMLAIEIDPHQVLDIMRFLKEDEIFRFRFLTDLCGVHFPEQPERELGVVYHLHSFENNFRIRVKAFFSEKTSQIASLTSLFPSANWQERETFDFYGIQFIGHPDLRRILNMDEMTYHPLLKQYTLEDPTRTDKADQYFGR